MVSGFYGVFLYAFIVRGYWSVISGVSGLVLSSWVKGVVVTYAELVTIGIILVFIGYFYFRVKFVIVVVRSV